MHIGSPNRSNNENEWTTHSSPCCYQILVNDGRLELYLNKTETTEKLQANSTFQLEVLKHKYF